MSRPEATLQKAIIDASEARGAYVVKVHQTGYTRRGIPDLLMCFMGYFVAFEVKVAASLTNDQRRELEAVRRSGGVRAVVRSLKTAMAVLDQVERHHAGQRAMGERVLVGHIPSPRLVALDSA